MSKAFILDLDKPIIPKYILTVRDREHPDADKEGLVRIEYDTIAALKQMYETGLCVYAKDKKGEWLFDKSGNRLLSVLGYEWKKINGELQLVEDDNLSLQEKIQIDNKTMDFCYKLFDFPEATVMQMLCIFTGFMRHVEKHNPLIEKEFAKLNNIGVQKKKSFSPSSKYGKRSASRGKRSKK